MGRMSITEVLEVDDTVRRMLLEGESSDNIKKYACEEKGMDTLWMDAMAKCLRGDTTLEEVQRITTSGH